MTKKYSLEPKTEYLSDLIGEAIVYSKLSRKEVDRYHAENSDQQIGESLIGTYLWDFIHAAVDVETELSLTYDSIGLLPKVLSSCLHRHLKEGLEFSHAASAVSRCFAAYLFCLGMNEHETELKVTETTDRSNGPLWAECLRIETGLRRDRDFLVSVLEGMNVLNRGDKGLMVINVTPVIRDYRAAFGVNLVEKGLVNMAVEAELGK